MGKRSPAPPPAPDYATLAIKQGEANLAAAKQSAYMSNPNIYSPSGTQKVTWTKTPTVDTDAYNKAMEAWQNQLYTNPEFAGEAPTQEQFTTYIEQPTVTQTISADAEAALRQQELAQRYMAQAAAGAAKDLDKLGIASAFNPTGIPSITYGVEGVGAVARPTDITQMGQAGALGQGAAGPVMGAPQGIYNPMAGYYIEGLPGQVGAGQQAGAGPAAPTNLGQLDASQFYAQSAPGGQMFGTAAGGPSGGLFGLAGGGPQGINLQGLDLSGIGGVSGGPQQGQFGYAQRFVQGPQLQSQIDLQGVPQAPINAGSTAQQAIMSRLSPQLQGERQQLQTQLINQGLRPGGEAYNAAMSAQMQKENDLILQAAAQGISLDQAARQQAFAEQQSRAMFANQAALSGFGAGMEQAGLYNVGAQQDLQSALATQAAQNQAQQQQFQQRLQTGEFGREAQLASFQTGQQAQQAINQAIAQNFAQSQAAQQMQNQAIGQNFEQALAAQQAQNAAIAQNYQQALGAGQFNREALLQQFGMGQSAQELANAAAAQNFQQQVAAQQANLARQAQQAGQSQEQAQFYNQAQAQAYQQELARQAAANQAQAQLFGQQMDVQAAQNAALAQRQSAAMDYFGALNAAQQQQYAQAMAQAQFRNTAAQQALAQQAAIRSIPVNEISALLSGGQVSVPQFQGYSGVTVAPSPIFQAGQAAGDFAQRNYQNQVGAYNAQMGLYGNIFGAAGTLLGGK